MRTMDKIKAAAQIIRGDAAQHGVSWQGFCKLVTLVYPAPFCSIWKAVDRSRTSHS